MHLGDEIGPGEHEVLVATLELGPAEVVGREVAALDPRAERAVEDEHPLTKCFEEAHEGSRLPEPLARPVSL